MHRLTFDPGQRRVLLLVVYKVRTAYHYILLSATLLSLILMNVILLSGILLNIVTPVMLYSDLKFHETLKLDVENTAIPKLVI
jgi:hypothetical protein